MVSMAGIVQAKSFTFTHLMIWSPGGIIDSVARLGTEPLLSPHIDNCHYNVVVSTYI